MRLETQIEKKSMLTSKNANTKEKRENMLGRRERKVAQLE